MVWRRRYGATRSRSLCDSGEYLSTEEFVAMKYNVFSLLPIFCVRRAQQGVSLIVALVFLLILTLLAVSGMREVALEARITGNVMDEKRLFNSGEAGLKDGELRTIGTLRAVPGKYSVSTALTPLNAVSTCGNTQKTCLLLRTPEYAQEFEENEIQEYSPDDVTTLSDDVVWYAIPAPSGNDSAENENPEYGNLVRGIGVFRYEVNTRAESANGEARLRSTVSRVYN